MGDIRIRNVDKATKDSIKYSARSLGLTMEEYILDLMKKDRQAVMRRVIAEARKGAQAIYKKRGLLSDSTKGIRAERDKRW